jgi:outer membrane murein-binding lipoprotein Lpp
MADRPPTLNMDALKNKQIKITIGVAITTILFVAGIVSRYTDTQNKIETRLCNLEDKVTIVASAVDNLQVSKHADDLRYTEIKVKLVNIESTLVEIKNKMK